ncbi:MAG: ATP-binding cassette domain-containing protein [Saprospiraceae bacterium]|nr:ATP-binding cassette domain-containing protein [Saprospiraceae bacterium]|tara:strand:+ start:7520 stop:8389 length:870 start_codon:yes stop_codon:yes gene_type:complete
MSLSLSHISKSYDSQKVLDGVDLSAKKGEVTALIGKNGAGKTTTFKIICGLISQGSGELKWDEEVVDVQSMKWKQKIGYLAEHNPLYSNLFVKEFLSFSCDLNQLAASKKRISETILEVGLEDHQHKQIKNLSKGFKQRVGLAQAIIHNPQLLILDEPTSGLDPSQLIEIRSLINNLSKDRVVILSSHILSEIEQICNKIYILKEGRTVQYSDENGHEAMRIIFNRPPEIAWFNSIGRTEIINNNELSIWLETKNSKEKIFDAAVANGIKIIEMRMENNLENAFVNYQK